MIYKAELIAGLIENPDEKDPLVIVPRPNLTDLRKSGSVSVDLRLGTWFVTPRQSRMSHLDIIGGKTTQAQFTKTSYVPFGSEYYLHPRSFVLGVTLEWVRLPKDFAGYIVGKSSWGRCGLIIATAAGVHPGFMGCLTLELSNIGEVPIPIIPGMTICQLFLHQVKQGTNAVDRSGFVGQRQPILDRIALDPVAKKLFKAYRMT
ncbi:MAG: dCTP deaminase [Desulfobacterales bacterium]|nr:dCTP deaminase [Desulfobacterales bacterium]